MRDNTAATAGCRVIQGAARVSPVTFTTVEGIEPTNNPAERSLRAPVIQRKVSLGTQSEQGERFAERALSAAGTCRLQRRSLFTYLSDLFSAHNRGDPFPALA